jgi:hypothetical protein
MRLILATLLIFIFFITGLSAGNIEVHSDHSMEEAHITDTTIYEHSHQEKTHNESNESNSCEHLHFHSSTPSQIIVSQKIISVVTTQEFRKQISTSYNLLHPQFVNTAFYRPPIS